MVLVTVSRHTQSDKTNNETEPTGNSIGVGETETFS